MSQEKIWRVINNIINNAIKFSYDNSCIHLLIRNAPSGIILSVEDEGVGIPETLKEKIFTTDHAITRAGTNGEETNGLGLIICQEIMLQHGGSIWFESVEGVGTTFYILFPSELVLV